MTEQSVYEALRGYQKGSYIRLGWKSTLGSSAAKKAGYDIQKQTETTGRIGIHYGNIASVKARKAEQEQQPEEEKKTYTVWFKHVEGHPEIVEHLKDATKRYLQIFAVKPFAYPKVKYFLNGVEISKQDLENTGLCTKSDLAPSSGSELFNIPLENLLFIGGKHD